MAIKVIGELRELETFQQILELGRVELGKNEELVNALMQKGCPLTFNVEFQVCEFVPQMSADPFEGVIRQKEQNQG